jgi:hypothetical protein
MTKVPTNASWLTHLRISSAAVAGSCNGMVANPRNRVGSCEICSARATFTLPHSYEAKLDAINRTNALSLFPRLALID